MIRLGNYILNEECIEAIWETPGGLSVATKSGNSFYIPEATAEEACDALSACELIGSPCEDIVSPALLPEEVAQLQQAYADGFLFAAKDLTGQVFAYDGHVEKGRRRWLHKASNRAKRLRGEFDALSFEDETPLDIAAALEGSMLC